MESNESKGPLVGIIIVVLILIAGGIYLMQSRSTTPGTEEPLGTVEQSDEVAALEATAALGAGVDDLDADLTALDQELGN